MIGVRPGPLLVAVTAQPAPKPGTFGSGVFGAGIFGKAGREPLH